jgi:VanZ family protein
MPDSMAAEKPRAEARGTPVVPVKARRIVVVIWLAYSVAVLVVSILPSEAVPKFLMFGWDKIANAITYLASLLADDTVYTYPIIGWDKIAHASAFLGLGALTVPVMLHRRQWIALTVSYSLAIAVISEWLQSYTPGRVPSTADVVAGLIGTGIAVIVSILWLRLFERAFGSHAKQTNG